MMQKHLKQSVQKNQSCLLSKCIYGVRVGDGGSCETLPNVYFGLLANES